MNTAAQSPRNDHLHMVDNQLRTAGVFDLKVIEAFLQVPRSPFVPTKAQAQAYSDAIIPLASIGAKGRTLMLPLLLGKILQAMGNTEGKSVLIIGGATGYSAALLCQMGAQVTLVETAELAQHAKAALASIGSGAQLVESALNAPTIKSTYDIILIEGSIAQLPDAFSGLLNDGGQLLTLLAQGPLSQVTRFIKASNGLSKSTIFEGNASLLPGFEAPVDFVF